MAKQAIIATPPKLTSSPRVDFLTPDFDALVWNKGYDVVYEKAIQCPCSMRTQNYQSSCMNCMGSGWIFINPVQTKAVLQSINRNTKYQQWSQEMLGTISVTMENRFQLSFMDKLRVIDSTIIYAENVLVRNFEGQLYAYTIYPIIDITECFLFIDVKSKLQFLINGVDFTFQENKILFNSSNIKEGSSISVRYIHNLQYNIIDINHDVRNSYLLDNRSREQQNLLPIGAIGRKSHYIIDALNVDGTNIYDNSQQTNNKNEYGQCFRNQ